MDEDSRLSVPKLAGIVLCSLVLVKIKMGAYFPLCLLILLINKKLFKSKKHYIGFIGGYLVLVMAIFLASRMGYFGKISGSTAAESAVETAAETEYEETVLEANEGADSETVAEPETVTYQNYISWADAEGYTIGYFIRNPGVIPRIVINTIQSFGSGYVEGMIGNPIGWSNYGWYYPDLMIYLFIALLILAAVSVESDLGMLTEPVMKLSERVLVWVAVLGAAGFVVGGMLFSWTPQTADRIYGVQGRYFIPMLPVLLMSLKNKSVISRKSTFGVIVAGCVILHLWAFWSICCFVAGWS
jgi:uncharacterized membrane protein